MLVVFVACSSEQQEQKQPDQYLPDSIDTEGMAISACLMQADRICDMGLSFAMLGQEVAMIDAEGLSITAIEDSTEFEGGYIWLQRTLHFQDGYVLLEGQFFQEKDYNPESLSRSLVNRIQVQTPSLATSKDIRVGSTIGDLLEKYDESEATIFSFGELEDLRGNPEYEVLQIKFEENPHINYLTPDPNFEIYQKLGADKLALNKLPEDGVISKIVIAR